MADGHPIVWLTVATTVSGLALTLDSPVALTALVIGLLITGFAVRGPRMASFAYSTIVAFACILVWTAWTLLVSGSAADSPVLFSLPSYSPGVGVRFGGTVTVSAVEAGLTSALAAACIPLAWGVAGQLVSARGWLSLARTLLGPMAPAAGWIACAPEAAAEVASQRRQRRGRHRTPVVSAWIDACHDLALDLPGAHPRVLLSWRTSDLAHVAAAAALIVAWILAPTYGAIPVAAAALLLPLVTALASSGRRALSGA